jgi:hypothetical protein
MSSSPYIEIPAAVFAAGAGGRDGDNGERWKAHIESPDGWRVRLSLPSRDAALLVETLAALRTSGRSAVSEHKRGQAAR